VSDKYRRFVAARLVDSPFEQLRFADSLGSLQSQTMTGDLRERLRRLGVHKGAAHLKPNKKREAKRVNREEHAVTSLEPIQTALGEAFVKRERFALKHRHGNRLLDAALAFSPEQLSQLNSNGGATLDLRDFLFLDTETTGLSGGAGTFAFLVGVGYFVTDDEGRTGFVVEQFFLKDPAKEAAMLVALDKLVNERNTLVTFNGKAFDVPLLETRFALSRIAPSFGDKTHLDLLLPARRVWRDWIGSCSLGSLEFHLLDVRRDQQDIAGFLIPQLYREFLQSGSDELTEDMQRVMYHNLHDILSMVTLIARLCDALTQPSDSRERFAAGVYFERTGQLERAEALYRSAFDSVQPDSNANAQQRLARLLKRQKRHNEAAALWKELAGIDDVFGLIELAKHYEWREGNLDGALASALRARSICADRHLNEEIEHRIERLKRKIEWKTKRIV
jgi:hypothetical protein